MPQLSITGYAPLPAENPSGSIIVRSREDVLGQLDQFGAPEPKPQGAQQGGLAIANYEPPKATDAERRDVLGFLANIPKSTGSLIGGMLNVPRQVEGMSNLFASMAAKSGFKPLPGMDTNAVDGLIAHYKDRYGSWEGFKKAVYEDPAGVAFDAAMVLEPGAAGLKAAGLTRAAAVTARTARAINPVVGTARLGGAVVRTAAPALEATADVAGAAAKAGGADIARGAAKAALGAGLAKYGPLGEIGDVLAGAPLVQSGLKQMRKGAGAAYTAGREAIAQRAATAAEAPAAAVEIPAAAPPTPPPAVEAPPASLAPAAAQALESSMRVDALTGYLQRNKIPGEMIDQFGPKEWKMVADQAGVQPPDIAQAASIRRNIADFEQAATLPKAAGKMAPAEAEAQFQAQKARRTPPEPPPETPPPAPAAVLPEGSIAVPEGSAVLEPLPEGVPAHYRDVQIREGTSNAARAYQKDRRIAQYILSKGITPEEFAAMPLEQQNKLIVEAPTASGKGRHRPFLQPAEGQLRTGGRWADEGVRHIAETMRGMEGTLPPEVARMSPAEAEQVFQEQKAKITRRRRKASQ